MKHEPETREATRRKMEERRVKDLNKVLDWIEGKSLLGVEGEVK